MILAGVLRREEGAGRREEGGGDGGARDQDWVPSGGGPLPSRPQLLLRRRRHVSSPPPLSPPSSSCCSPLSFPPLLRPLLVPTPMEMLRPREWDDAFTALMPLYAPIRRTPNNLVIHGPVEAPSIAKVGVNQLREAARSGQRDCVGKTMRPSWESGVQSSPRSGAFSDNWTRPLDAARALRLTADLVRAALQAEPSSCRGRPRGQNACRADIELWAMANEPCGGN
eukprot:4858860-Pyramimonas_sp.AAC.1